MLTIDDTIVPPPNESLGTETGERPSGVQTLLVFFGAGSSKAFIYVFIQKLRKQNFKNKIK
jgi:hypothetical protein